MTMAVPDVLDVDIDFLLDDLPDVAGVAGAAQAAPGRGGGGRSATRPSSC